MNVHRIYGRISPLFRRWRLRQTRQHLEPIDRLLDVGGWFDRPDARAVDKFLAEVRLLIFSEMQQLFPDCTLRRERFLGFTKSYIALRTALS